MVTIIEKSHSLTVLHFGLSNTSEVWHCLRITCVRFALILEEYEWS